MKGNSQRFRRWRRRLARRLRRNAVVQGTGVLLGLIVLTLFLPVILPLAAVLHARDLRRKRLAAACFVCVGCGQVLGQAALDRADAEWAEFVAKLHREHPGYRFRLVRDVDAVCLHCGARYHFDQETRTFCAPVARDNSRSHQAPS